MVVHDLIVQYVNEHQVAYHNDLELYIEENFLVKSVEANKAISEAVQANLIKRYEYILSGESTRRCFYMPFDSRIML